MDTKSSRRPKGLYLLSLRKFALRSKRREVFLSVVGSCYTTFDAKLFEDAATLLPAYIILLEHVWFCS